MEIFILAGLAALGELSLQKLGAGMVIVAVLTAMSAHGVRSQVKNHSRYDTYITRNRRLLRVTIALMRRFAAITAVLGAATALLGIAA